MERSFKLQCADCLDRRGKCQCVSVTMEAQRKDSASNVMITLPPAQPVDGNVISVAMFTALKNYIRKTFSNNMPSQKQLLLVTPDWDWGFFVFFCQIQIQYPLLNLILFTFQHFQVTKG